MNNSTVNPHFKKALWLALLCNAIWINASEVFRYFVFVMPMMRESLAGVADVAPMSLPVFLIWGVWDTILVCVVTGFIWIALDYFGNKQKIALLAGSGVWLAIFGILWLGLFNMNLATIEILIIALPLSWLEMIVAALIVYHWRSKYGLH